MSIESVMPSNHLILCHPLLLPSITILYLSLQTRTYTWSNSELGTMEESKKHSLTFNTKVGLSTAGRQPLLASPVRCMLSLW